MPANVLKLQGSHGQFLVVTSKIFPPANRKRSDLSKVSSSESPSPLPQSPHDEDQTFFSSSEDVPFKTTQSEQSSVTPCTTDDNTSSKFLLMRFLIHHYILIMSLYVYLTDESIAEPHTD